MPDPQLHSIQRHTRHPVESTRTERRSRRLNSRRSTSSELNSGALFMGSMAPIAGWGNLGSLGALMGGRGGALSGASWDVASREMSESSAQRGDLEDAERIEKAPLPDLELWNFEANFDFVDGLFAGSRGTGVAPCDKIVEEEAMVEFERRDSSELQHPFQVVTSPPLGILTASTTAGSPDLERGASQLAFPSPPSPYPSPTRNAIGHKLFIRKGSVGETQEFGKWQEGGGESQSNSRFFHLSWHDLVYRVSEGSHSQIRLNKSSGYLQPGSLTALMGPSGSGKTTLLNILSGKYSQQGGELRGDVCINGQPVDVLHSNYAPKIAYVPQGWAATVQPKATPYEVLLFAARLRASGINQRRMKWIRKDEKGKKRPLNDLECKRRVSMLLTALGLERCQHDMCELLNQGQRTRTFLGVMLLSVPSVLLLDEPLNGLSVFEAWLVCRVLKKLSRKGVSVMMTVHQPNSEIFFSFDEVLFLSKGSALYQGPPSSLPLYIQHGLGYDCPPKFLPADYFIFLMQSSSASEHRRLADAWQWHLGTESAEDPPPLMESAASVLQDTSSGQKRPPVWAQFRYLLLRDVRDTGRSWPRILVTLLVGMLLSTLLGAFFWKVGSNHEEQVRLCRQERESSSLTNTTVVPPLEGAFPPNSAIPYLLIYVDPTTSTACQLVSTTALAYYGGIVFVVLGSLFGHVESVAVSVPLIRKLFLAEYSTCLYSSSIFLLSHVLVQTPVAALKNFIHLCICYWMMDFQGNFLIWLCVLLLSSLATTSAGWLIASSTRSPQGALQALQLLFLPQLLFSGLLIDVNRIPQSISWLSYISFVKYCINLGFIAEMKAGDDPLPDSSMQKIAVSNNIQTDARYAYYGIVLAFIGAVFSLAGLALHKQTRYLGMEPMGSR